MSIPIAEYPSGSLYDRNIKDDEALVAHGAAWWFAYDRLDRLCRADVGGEMIDVACQVLTDIRLSIERCPEPTTAPGRAVVVAKLLRSLNVELGPPRGFPWVDDALRHLREIALGTAPVWQDEPSVTGATA